MTAIVYIGIGANLDNPKRQVELAIDSIAQLRDSKLDQYSSLYISPPMGPQDQEHYINAVVKITTILSPVELLDELQLLEKKQGRVRGKVQWGPRTIDLDILLHDQLEIEEPRLKIPHYGMKERAFVLIPLAEIIPELTLPDKSILADLIKQLGNQGLKKL